MSVCSDRSFCVGLKRLIELCIPIDRHLRIGRSWFPRSRVVIPPVALGQRDVLEGDAGGREKKERAQRAV
jgi:hypothetical protein